jgi:hypothetical protein
METIDDEFWPAISPEQSFRVAADDEIVWFGVPPARVDLLKSAGGVDSTPRRSGVRTR